MLYEIAVGQALHQVRVEWGEGGSFRARVGERVLEGRWAPGHLLIEGRSFEYGLGRDQAGHPVEVMVGAVSHRVEVLSMGARRRGGREGGAAEGAGGRVMAPMNGRVLKILLEEGSPVEPGQVVLVLEAMKMENEVTAPVAGVLGRLGVEAGETVQPGRLLFEVIPGGSN